MATIREYHIRRLGESSKFEVEALVGLCNTYYVTPSNDDTTFNSFKQARDAARENAKANGVTPFICNYS